MNISKIFDALIIGGGPAGLSTALGLGRVHRSCVVFSNGVFRNDGIEASHAVLGHDHIHPQEIWAKGREQIKRYDNTVFEEAEIVTASRTSLSDTANSTGFVVSDTKGRSWKGRTLVMATGVKDVFPDLAGYADNWPRSIYQCPFCDGYERRQEEKGILCYPSFQPMHAKMAAMFDAMAGSRESGAPSKVTILTNGEPNSNKDEITAKGLQTCQARGYRIDTRRVVKLVNVDGHGEKVDVYLEDGDGKVESLRFGFLSHKPRTAPRAAHLIEQLGLETVAGMFGDNIKVQEPFQSTNVPGVFAAGDTGSAMTHVTSALTSGVGAAAGIAHLLNDRDDAMYLQDYLHSSKKASETIESIEGHGVPVEVCTQD